jgi:hypothetical protein
MRGSPALAMMVGVDGAFPNACATPANTSSPRAFRARLSPRKGGEALSPRAEEVGSRRPRWMDANGRAAGTV